MSLKSLEYAVLRLVDALPQHNADSLAVRRDVQHALGVADDADQAARTTADARDSVAGSNLDDNTDANTSGAQD